MGIPAIIINRHGTTADTPRAHIINSRALECLRDAGLEDQARALSTPHELMTHTTWAESMCGKEFARIYSWGNDPKRKGEYELTSPCYHSDLPQTLLEPMLLREATLRGTVRNPDQLELMVESQVRHAIRKFRDQGWLCAHKGFGSLDQEILCH